MDINKDWSIDSDALNITLRKGGKAIGYYSTIKSALKGMVQQGIKDTCLVSLRALDEKIDELYNLIDSLDIH